MTTISEEQFRTACYKMLETFRGVVNSVTGPGRSGAIAGVYASHYLGVPYIPLCGSGFKHPVLVIDTAIDTGRTLRKAKNKISAEFSCAVFNEPPRVKFWYEQETI